MAATKGHAEVIKELAPFSKNPNAPNDSGFTPMDYAAMNGYIDVVKVLTPFFENPNQHRKPRTPIHLAAKE